MSDLFNLDAQRARLSRRHTSEPGPGPAPTLPPLSAIKAAEASLPRPGSEAYLQGMPQEQVLRHIAEDIVPACNGPASSSRYYGFVTGGTLPIAEWADNVVSRVDQNVQVHLPTQTVATTVEDAALEMLAALLGLTGFRGRTFTTGATGSNVLGIACGREHIVGKRLDRGETVGELGLLAACATAGIKELQILTSAGHSSLSKAASVVGFGRASVKELRLSGDEPWRLDIDALERELQREGVASVIALSAGEVNTGRFSLTGVEEMERVRELADQYGAWVHVDGGEYMSLRVMQQTGPVVTDIASIRHLCSGTPQRGRLQDPSQTCARSGTCRQHHGRWTQAPQCGEFPSCIKPQESGSRF